MIWCPHSVAEWFVGLRFLYIHVPAYSYDLAFCRLYPFPNSYISTECWFALAGYSGRAENDYSVDETGLALIWVHVILAGSFLVTLICILKIIHEFWTSVPYCRLDLSILFGVAFTIIQNSSAYDITFYFNIFKGYLTNKNYMKVSDF